jgi:hypothetical protein
MGDELERVSKDQNLDQVSMDEIEAEGATALPNKEVMSLLDVNANVDLGLNLAAPVDLAAAANLNVAAPIEAAASANLLSADAQAVAISQQHGTIDQGISGSAEATAPQNAEIIQDANPDEPATTGGATAGTDTAGATPVAGATDGTTGALEGATGTVGDAVGSTTGDVGGVVDGATGAVDGATGGATDGLTEGAGGAVDGATGGLTDGAGGAVGDVGGAVPDVGDAAGGVTGGVESLLSGGSLLDADVNIHANADLTAPVNGAIAANANVAAPINASVAANIGSDGAVAQSLADQQVDIHQDLDDVSADATAEQDATIDQE